MLQGLQNLALRRILGCFKSAPIKPTEVEACLCPPEVGLNHCRRKYAMRALSLAEKHPVSKAMRQNLDYLGDRIDTLKPSLQLEKIRGSISQHLDEEEMEKVTSNSFTPWGAELPYSIEIGSLDKEKENFLYVQGIRESFGKNHIFYYTNAS
ncbi:hypothetical protein K3495_g3336 [Podosphaera aphanis]|nr:hypothetical protein K3495_g3336 [Podosphaera aphanis]